MQKNPGIERIAEKRRPRRAAFSMKLFLRIEEGRNTGTVSDSMGAQYLRLNGGFGDQPSKQLAHLHFMGDLPLTVNF